jgi:hypothetical protein
VKNAYITFMILVPLLTISGIAGAQSFTGRLSGAQEVPPSPPLIPGGVQTTASGSVAVTFSPPLSSLNFKLDVSNAMGVIAAHFHCGRPGQNGPIVIPLFESPSPSGVNRNGVLAARTLTNANFAATASECDAAIGRPVNNIASLAFAARDGLIYANVHTVTNTEGEFRAQLVEQNRAISP